MVMNNELIIYMLGKNLILAAKHCYFPVFNTKYTERYSA